MENQEEVRSKVETVMQQIQEILNKEGLTLMIDHIIRVMPKQGGTNGIKG